MLEVRALGGLGAVVDGVPIALPADARARELLAWLALNPGLHARSALAGRLRPDVAEESARKTLRDAVYELRRALGPAGRDAVVATRDRVGLRDEDVRVDLREFRARRAAGALEEAVAAGDGELLAGLDEDWVLRARAEHLAEWADTLGALAERAEARGDAAAAVAWARRRAEADPLAERAALELVRLLAGAGDRPAALAAAAAFSERLRRELGIPPSPATRALIAEVRAGGRGGGEAAGAGGGGDHPLPAPLARTSDPAGREPSLARLETAWEDAAAGTLRIALVTGEPGIGKTTLAGELARRLHARGAIVLYGRCDEQTLVPYQPWVEALDVLLAGVPAAEADRWLAAHDGALARLLPTRGPGAGEPGEGAHQRYLAFETVRALLRQTSRARPVLLVVDDVHWADPDTLQLMRHLARATFGARVMVVLCARDGEMSGDCADTIAALRREGPLVEVPLTGLDAAALAAVLERRLGATDPAAVRRYGTRTGGNPFFLEELMRHEGEGGTDAPPASVRDVVAARLARLDPSTRSALAQAAVVGLEFDVSVVATAMGATPGRVLSALDGADEAGLVVPVGTRGRYAFAHAIVQEAIVAGLAPSEAARLHLGPADVLEARHAEGGVPAGEVVRHLRAAGPLVEAPRLRAWELIAASEATAALAHAEAAGHLEAALAGLPPSPDRAETLIGLGRARDRAGKRASAREAFGEAAAIARDAGEAGLLARAALGHGGLAVVIAGPDPEVTALLGEALAVLPAADRAMAARLRARLAIELYYSDPARSRDLSARAVDDARAADDPSALAAALNARRVALWDPDHMGERLAASDAMVAAAERAGDREAALQGRNWRVVDLLEAGRVGEAASEIDEYEALAESVGLPHYRWYVPLWRAGLAILAGRWDEARELGHRAEAVGERAADPNAPLLARVQRQCALDRRFRTGEQERDWMAEMAATSPVPGPWLSSLALIDAARGRRAEARALIDELVRDDCAAMPMDANWHASCELAEAAADIGHREAAAILHRRLLPYAGLYAVVARGVSCYSVTDHHLGRLALTLGRPDEAERRLRRAAEAHDAIGARPHAAVTRLRLAEALRAGGDAEAARTMLAEVVSRAGELDMPGLAAAASSA